MAVSRITTPAIANLAITQAKIASSVDLGGAVKIANVQVANSSWSLLDDTAVDTDGGYVLVNGTNFVSGCNVLVGNVAATSVTFVSATQLRVQVPATAAGSYIMYVSNPDGATGIRLNAITFSADPQWVTDSTLASQSVDSAISVQLSATDATSYSLQAGSSLPANTTLASNGLFSGTITGINEDTVYNFTVVATDAENQDSPRAFSVTVTVGDTYFKETVLLLNADANTFIRDASNNSFNITPSGDVRPSAFSPYNTNWSNFFDGTSGQYLNAPANTAFNLGTGDFTVEAWIFPTSTSGTRPIIEIRTAAVNSTGFAFLSQSGAQTLNVYTNNGFVGASTNTYNLNQWNHVALTRSGNTWTYWINGVSGGSFTNSSTQSDGGTTGPKIAGSTTTGEIWRGYISNARITKGGALYTSTFTPSTTPLTTTVSAGTVSLLTCQSNRLIDNSTNAFTITKNGDVKVLTFGPFTETDTTTGSGFFDGSGDYITIADNAALEPSNLDWTIEAWIYPTSNASNTYYAWFSKNGTGYGAFYFAQRNLGFYIFLSYTGSAWDVHGVNSNYSCGTMTLNAWNHVAITRSGQTVRGFLNGVLGTTITLSSAGVSLVDQANPLMLGAQSNGGEPVAGYMSNFRYVRGTSLYTSNFTPPTSQLTAVANTAVLTLQNFQSINNHTFIDESASRNNVTRNGNPSMGSFSPFSPARWSNFFDGSGDTLTLSRTVLTDLSAASAWTIEFWAFKTATSAAAYSLIMSTDASGNSNGSVFSLNNTNFVVGGQGHAGFPQLSTPANSTSVNRWHHIAIVKNSGTLKIYIDGVERASNTQSTTFPNVADLMLGNRSSADLPFTGYISNLRVVNGTAVYTSAFTPPTSELTAIANTSLLMCQSNRFKDYSSNNFTITRNGDTKVVNFSPFKPTDVYSLATHGGSAYFDGSDYLQTNSTDSGLITTGPFTIELWIYPLSLNTNIMSRFYWQTGDNGGWFLNINTSGFIGFSYSTGVWNSHGGTTATSNPIKINEWSHIAITRDSSNTLRIFVNGLSSVTPITLAQSLDTYRVQQSSLQPRTFKVAVGGPYDGALSGYYTGYISSVKIQTGVAKYTADFTPALQTFPNDSGINYLSNMNTMGIVDITSRNVMETVGNVSLNSTKKFGTGSLTFDGSGDYIFSRALDIFTLSGDFTIEGWAYLNATGNYRLCTLGDSVGASGIEIYVSGGNWTVYSSGAIRITGAAATRQTWIHIAVVRSGSTVTLYVNGTASGSTWSSSSTFSGACYIGAEFYNGSVTADTNGYIDDLRITRFARYTANFTAPTLTFLTQ